ncbi:MAG: hypothetical protein KDA90_17410 [Planctomycetaceae bacterium]|nr:hypothetical protein [Planctomycetaceae bacterium]
MSGPDKVRDSNDAEKQPVFFPRRVFGLYAGVPLPGNLDWQQENMFATIQRLQ